MTYYLVICVLPIRIMIIGIVIPKEINFKPVQRVTKQLMIRVVNTADVTFHFEGRHDLRNTEIMKKTIS